MGLACDQGQCFMVGPKPQQGEPRKAQRVSDQSRVNIVSCNMIFSSIKHHITLLLGVHGRYISIYIYTVYIYIYIYKSLWSINQQNLGCTSLQGFIVLPEALISSSHRARISCGSTRSDVGNFRCQQNGYGSKLGTPIIGWLIHVNTKLD